MAATKFRLYKDALRHLADARLSVITDDTESRYALDDAYDQAVEFVLRQAAWRFALKTSRLTVAAGSQFPGFSTAFTKPDDWLLTHALFLLNDDRRERPLDIREQGDKFYANIGSGIVHRYVSKDFVDPEMAGSPWPEHFAQTVAAYLAFLVADRVTGEHGASGRMSQLFSSLLRSATEHDAIAENPWLQYQLDGSYARCMPVVIGRGWWRFALRTMQFDANVVGAAGGQDTGFDLVYPYRFPIPSDWVETHALFINWNGTECPFDIKERQGFWLTATPLFLARYMSTDAYDSTLWPDSLAKAVQAYLGLESSGDPEEAPAGQKGDPTSGKAELFQAALAAALDDASEPTHPWLRHQLSGQFLQQCRWVLEQARWRFAIKSVELNENSDPLPGDPIELVDDGTGTGGVTVTAPAQHGYAYRFIKPNDWLRTIWFGRQINEGLAGSHIDTDYIDEGYTLHANWSPLSLRYLSTEKGLDPTQWTAHFRDALLAYLEHIEARANPKLASLAAERFKFFQMQLREAESNDDSRDGPLYRQVGRVVRARYGWGRGYGIGPGYGPSQGWWG